MKTGHRSREPDSVGLIAVVDAVVEKLGSAKQALAAARLEGDELEAERLRLEGEARHWAEAQEVCPTCGMELDPEAIVATALSGRGVHSHE